MALSYSPRPRLNDAHPRRPQLIQTFFDTCPLPAHPPFSQGDLFLHSHACFPLRSSSFFQLVQEVGKLFQEEIPALVVRFNGHAREEGLSKCHSTCTAIVDRLKAALEG